MKVPFDRRQLADCSRTLIKRLWLPSACAIAFVETASFFQPVAVKAWSPGSPMPYVPAIIFLGAAVANVLRPSKDSGRTGAIPNAIVFSMAAGCALAPVPWPF